LSRFIGKPENKKTEPIDNQLVMNKELQAGLKDYTDFADNAFNPCLPFIRFICDSEFRVSRLNHGFNLK